MQNSSLDAALDYAKRGFPVFPLHNPINSNNGLTCSCGNPKCEPKAKHPRISGGFKSATIDAATIKEWWSKWPNANIGIATGAASGLDVVDIDNDAARQKLKELVPDTSAAALQKTGRGWQVAFAHAPDSGLTVHSELGDIKGLDFRGDGGYIVAAPSQHITGKFYKWQQPLAGELPTLPDSFIKFALAALKTKSAGSDGARERFNTASALAGVPEGQRDQVIFKLACKLRSADIPQAMAETLILEAARKCEPQFSEDIAREKVQRVYSRYETNDQRGAPTKQGEIWPEFLTAKEILQAPKDPTRWIVGECLPAGGASVLVAKPKVGKSTIAADLAISVARGRPWLGRETQQTAVAYVFLDGPLTDIADTFVQLGLRESDPVFIHAGSAPADAIAWILAAVKDKGAPLVIIDVLQKLCRFQNINDYSEVTTKMEPLLEAARAGNCHVMTLHHAKKESHDDLDAAIGSTAIRGLAYTYMFAKRLANSERRILSSDQRGGKNFGEVGIGFDKLTGRLYIQGTIESVEIEEAEPLILKVLEGEGDQRESDIRKAVPMRGWIVGRALRALVKKGDIERTGTGKKGQAFLYSLAISLMANGERPMDHSDGLLRRGIVKGETDSSPSFHSLGSGTSGLASEQHAQPSEKTVKDSSPKSRDKKETTTDENLFSGGSGLAFNGAENQPENGWEKLR